MAEKKYRIKLSEEERKELRAVVASKAAVSKRHRAQILLCADENHEQGGMKDRDIARAVGVSVPSVKRTRCALAEHGLVRRMKTIPLRLLRLCPTAVDSGCVPGHRQNGGRLPNTSPVTAKTAVASQILPRSPPKWQSPPA